MKIGVQWIWYYYLKAACRYIHYFALPELFRLSISIVNSAFSMPHCYAYFQWLGNINSKIASSLDYFYAVRHRQSDLAAAALRALLETDNHRIKNGFAVTVVNANPSGFSGEKYMLFAEFGSNRLKEFKNLIYSIDPKAFLMVQETKHVINSFVRK